MPTASRIDCNQLCLCFGDKCIGRPLSRETLWRWCCWQPWCVLPVPEPHPERPLLAYGFTALVPLQVWSLPDLLLPSFARPRLCPVLYQIGSPGLPHQHRAEKTKFTTCPLHVQTQTRLSVGRSWDQTRRP